MNPTKKLLIVLPAILLLTQFFLGCGSSPETQNKNFYTSGNREADERASQRMAQANQLKGGGEASDPKKAPDKKTLYDRLGSADGIAAVTDDFVNRMLADPRVNFRRTGITQGGLSLSRGKSMEWDPSSTNVKLLKIHISEFFALATGGPSNYQGKPIKEAHTNLHITNDEFDASVGDLKATLDKLQVPNTEQKELLAIVESTRGEIVEER
jgi:hemoglobin